MNEILSNIVTIISEKYVVQVLASCITCTSSFDLWMSCTSYMFIMVVSFIKILRAHPFIVGVFEVQNTTSATMAN